MSILKSKIAIAVHGGAGQDSSFIQQNQDNYKNGLSVAIQTAYEALAKGASALDAVEVAVRIMEDNPVFNAGRGSALNTAGGVEMDAAIMNGIDLRAGAVAVVTNVRNPISLARKIMENTQHVFIGGKGALEYAKKLNLEVEPDSYFITTHRYDELVSEKELEREQILKRKSGGTVGAVALDLKGNIAAATSTGGIVNGLEGRIGDSCIIGAGCYADNGSCAISGTGDGEYLIRGVVGHSIASLVEFSSFQLQDACDEVVLKRNSHINADIGVIGIDRSGNFGISFNCPRMHRAWMSSDSPLQIKIYK